MIKLISKWLYKWSIYKQCRRAKCLKCDGKGIGLLKMDIKNRHCQYFFDGFWQPCKLIDFHNVKTVGIIYSIEFKGNLFSVFDSEVRFLKLTGEQLIVTLPKINTDAEVVFH